MSDARHALMARDSHIWTLRIIILGLFALLMVCIYVISNTQDNLKIHVPADLSQGAHVKPGELEESSSYSFALYVWRGVNDWPKSGRDDVKKNLDKYKCFISPNFFSSLEKQFESKKYKGELDRTRVLFAPLPYDSKYVSKLGNNTFSVALAVQLQERVDSMPVKDLMMLYSLRVVPDSRECNDMGMMVDGFIKEPERLETDNAKPTKPASGEATDNKDSKEVSHE